MMRQYLVCLGLLQLCFCSMASLESYKTHHRTSHLRIRDETLVDAEVPARVDSLSLVRRYLKDIYASTPDLDLKSRVLTSLVSYFTPAMARTIQKTLQDDFDPLPLGNTTTQDLGDIFIGPCHTSAEIVYDMKVLRGLGSVHLDNIIMVPESDNISVSLLDGATWNVTWILNATFANLNATANATLHIDACGNPIDQHLEGTTEVDYPSISLTLYVQGETSNLILFQSTSKVVKVDILELGFHYHSVEAHLGSFGEFTKVDLVVELKDILDADATGFESIMRETLQAAIDDELPFRPDSI